MRQLIDGFPRKIAKPNKRTCDTETDFYNFINRHNGKANLFFSVYKLDENGEFINIDINKIPFDLDEDEKSLDDTKRLHNHLKEQDIKHLILFSGKKGFHVYIFTINYENILNPKSTLKNAQNFFINTLDLTADNKIVGDVARVLRIPNTWHLTGKRYCIPLLSSDLDKGWKHIKEKAKTQHFEFKYYGTKLLDIKQFDFETKKTYAFDMPEYKYDIPIDDDSIKKFHPCVKLWLLNTDEMGTYEARYEFAKYCRDIGLSPAVCDDFAKKYFGAVRRTDYYKNNYIHFKRVHVLKYAYEKEEFVRNCSTLFDKGLCKGKCRHYSDNNFPLYKK